MGKSGNGNGTERSRVHLVLQGKGGVGKSFVSSILAQYLGDKERPVHCFDTDPINATFAQYSELNAEHVNVLRRGAIDARAFDSVVEKICRGDDPQPVGDRYRHRRNSGSRIDLASGES
jgi:cellulose biosynthesis protein BcsQ